MLKPLRALIVDDEPAARRRLALLCADLAGLAVVGEAADGEAALAFVAREPVDLLFLDIEMPGLDGMAVAERLGAAAAAPAVVFVTAFDRFALAAFGVNAAGYLLKPVDPDALGRLVARLQALPRRAAAPSRLEAIWAPHRGELVRVGVDDIAWIGGEGDYARVHVGRRSYLLAERLHVLEAQLDVERFLRVHRSAIVRLGAVTGLANLGAGAWGVVLATGVTIPVGRTRLAALRARLGADRAVSR